MKNTEQKQKISAYKQKKLMLSSISRKMREVRKIRADRAETQEEAEYWATRTINQMLMKILYNKNGDQVFNTFNQWKKEGATVKKGAKAIVIWGQPTKATKEKEKKNKNDESEFEEFEFFPLCYLISSKDVIFPENQIQEEEKEPERAEVIETFELA